MNGRYYKFTKEGLKWIDPDEYPFGYDMEVDAATDPVEFISEMQIVAIRTQKIIRRDLSWIKACVFILIACEVYRYLS